MQLPSNLVKQNQYASIGKFFFKDSLQPYSGYYNQIGTKYYTGKFYDKDSLELLSLKDTLLSKVKKVVPFDVSKRYFIKKTNETNIQEIGGNKFQEYINNPLYVAVEVDVTNPTSVQQATTTLPELKNFI
jgi:hypothetical protein